MNSVKIVEEFWAAVWKARNPAAIDVQIGLRAKRLWSYSGNSAGVARPVPDDISATIALNFGRLADGPICKAFGQAEPIHHPVDRVARYAQQVGRTMAIALGRLQRANQCELRGLADYGIERVGPILRRATTPGLGQIGCAVWQHRID